MDPQWIRSVTAKLTQRFLYSRPQVYNPPLNKTRLSFFRPYVNAVLLLAQVGPISARCTSLLLGAIEGP